MNFFSGGGTRIEPRALCILGKHNVFFLVCVIYMFYSGMGDVSFVSIGYNRLMLGDCMVGFGSDIYF